MRAAACLECAAARAATRYRSAATVSCTTDLLRRGSAHCTRSADIAATLAVNEWFELEGPRVERRSAVVDYFPVCWAPSSRRSPRPARIGGISAHTKARLRPAHPARLVWPMPPPLPGPDHRDQGSYQAANASVRCRSAIVVGVSGRKLRRREVAAELVRPPDASPPGRAPLSRGGPRCATVADLGFRRPACSPLAVVASEPTLGATAYEGGGGAGVRSRSPAAAG